MSYPHANPTVPPMVCFHYSAEVYNPLFISSCILFCTIVFLGVGLCLRGINFFRKVLKRGMQNNTWEKEKKFQNKEVIINDESVTKKNY